VPRILSELGLIGYLLFLAGSILAMFNLINLTHGAGMLALVRGGLFELICRYGSSRRGSLLLSRCRWSRVSEDATTREKTGPCVSCGGCRVRRHSKAC
jgi:hypothetical protein